jgi:hypothetical protein
MRDATTKARTPLQAQPSSRTLLDLPLRFAPAVKEVSAQSQASEREHCARQGLPHQGFRCVCACYSPSSHRRRERRRERHARTRSCRPAAFLKRKRKVCEARATTHLRSADCPALHPTAP